MMYALVGGVILALLGLAFWQTKKAAKEEVKADVLEKKDEAVKEAMDSKRNVLVDDDERERLFDKYTR